MREFVICALAACATLASAQQFQLKTADGALTGPFEWKEGALVEIGGTKATVVNVKSQGDEVLDAMQRIVIPEMDFRSANLHDIVQFLQEASLESDPQHRGVNIILNLAQGQPLAVSDPFEDETRYVPPPVAFSARHVTLLEALTIVTEIAGLKYRLIGSTVMIVPRNAPEGEIVTRMYDVLPTLYEKVAEVQKSSSKPEEERSPDYKRFFAELGVAWPSGSSIKYIPALGKLVVSNTRENMETLENTLALIRVLPTQVEVELKFVAFDAQRIADLGPNGISAESLTALWTNGHGELLAAPRVTTQSGVEAATKGVTECIYPTQFTLGGATGTNMNTNATAAASLVEPGGFETREVGAILTVLPEIGMENNMINITLSPELVEDPVWEDFGGPFTDPGGVTQQAHMRQPYFHCYSFTTMMIVANGHTVLASGGMPSRDRKRLVYAFLTARLVGIRGEPIKSGGSGEE